MAVIDRSHPRYINEVEHIRNGNMFGHQGRGSANPEPTSFDPKYHRRFINTSLVARTGHISVCANNSLFALL
jgi:hypothetical protein